jgi:type I restriction enzyme S subunit
VVDDLDAAAVSLGQLLATAPLFSDGDWVESKDQDPDGDIRLIQLADVGEGEFRDRSRRFLNNETAARLRCTYLAEGDVLVARMPDPLGRACIFPGVDQRSVTAVDVCIIRPGDQIEPAWLMHALNAPGARRQIEQLQSGTTRRRISRKNLATVMLRMPPLDEQRRIVAEVEQRLSAIDALRAAIERAQRRSAALRRAVLERAFRGELVPQDPSDEPASVLLDRIRAARDTNEGHRARK